MVLPDCQGCSSQHHFFFLQSLLSWHCVYYRLVKCCCSWWSIQQVPSWFCACWQKWLCWAHVFFLAQIYWLNRNCRIIWKNYCKARENQFFHENASPTPCSNLLAVVCSRHSGFWFLLFNITSPGLFLFVKMVGCLTVKVLPSISLLQQQLDPKLRPY